MEELEQARADLAAAQARIAELQGQVTTLAGERDTHAGAHSAAVAKYREKVLGELPEATHSLVAGDTIEQVEASATTARALVESLRTQAAAAPVPSGGTTRQAVDTSAMSASEKLRYGIAQHHQQAS